MNGLYDSFNYRKKIVKRRKKELIIVEQPPLPFPSALDNWFLFYNSDNNVSTTRPMTMGLKSGK